MKSRLEQKSFSVSEVTGGSVALAIVVVIAFVALPPSLPPAPAEPSSVPILSTQMPVPSTGSAGDQIREPSDRNDSARDMQPSGPIAEADNPVVPSSAKTHPPTVPAVDLAVGRDDGTTADAQAADIQRAITRSNGLLDLLKFEDAARVQQRLIEVGFLSRRADGIWGPRSRSALRDFRVANDLGSDDTWDGRTQRELFAATLSRILMANQPELPVQTGEVPIPPPPEAARNPQNRPDAIWIQARLGDLGYFSGDRNGIWGMTSRNAIRDFKSMNGLQVDDRWDKETEQRLSSTHAIPAARTFIGGWAEDIGQCQPLSRGISAPLVITSRTAKTADGKCDFKFVEREADGRWRIAALCATEGNSWNANIHLALDTPNLNWSSERGTATYVRCAKP